MSGIFKDKVPFEDFLKLITPASLWFKQKMLSTDQKMQLLADAIHNVHTDCAYRHPHNHLIEVYRKGADVTLRSIKLYVLVHVLPYILFKRGKDKYSAKNLLKLLKNIFNSLVFIGGFAVIGEIFLCYLPNLLKNFSPRWCFYASGAASASVFFEDSSRWAEFSLTVFPRLLESWKTYFAKQKLWIDIPHGLKWMSAFTFAVIAHVYNTDKECVKRQIRFVLNLILGEPILPEERKEEKAKEIQAEKLPAAKEGNL
jgi:hypothetical protein